MTEIEASLILKAEIVHHPEWSIFAEALDVAIQALEKQINGRWISVNDRFPEEAYGCLVTVMDCDPYLMKDYENIYPEPVGWDGKSWNNSDGHEIPFEVLAWMPLPEPYKESDEE